MIKYSLPEKPITDNAIRGWIKEFPVIEKVIDLKPVFWRNHRYSSFNKACEDSLLLPGQEVNQAIKDFKEFSSYISKAFPETKQDKGIIESDFVPVKSMKKEMEHVFGINISGRLYLKKDSHLAVSGSIKARGGFYEVLKHAKDLAVKKDLLKTGKEFSSLFSKKAKDFFSQYSIGVGSTGNLGLSIGIMGKSLGFKVHVHMSADARQWKKDLLRSKGVIVIEHNTDYTCAVEQGRKEAGNDPNMYFVDDENSKNLFLGYSVAGQRLKTQLRNQKIIVDDSHPLFVYLPCGVGGAAGGITLGLKQIFQDNVHCFFAEPTHSPSVLLGLMTGEQEKVCVQDVGIDNMTAADGLAVGRPSGFVSQSIKNIVSGIYTLEDNDLFRLLFILKKSENVYMEPSAHASMAGPIRLFKDTEGQKYLQLHKLDSIMDKASHIVWGTGGSMVPEEIKQADFVKGEKLFIKQKQAMIKNAL